MTPLFYFLTFIFTHTEKEMVMDRKKNHNPRIRPGFSFLERMIDSYLIEEIRWKVSRS